MHLFVGSDNVFVPKHHVSSMARALSLSLSLHIVFLNFRDGAEVEAQDLSRRWKSDADTVVIGGGIAGCSVAYHLAKLVGFLCFFDFFTLDIINS